MAVGPIGHHAAMTAWIDTHCHLDAAEFSADGAAVRSRAAAQGVVHCVLPAVEVGNFTAVRELAHRHGDSYALGIHPLCTGSAAAEDLDRLDEALTAFSGDPRLVAVGEIGLDDEHLRDEQDAARAGGVQGDGQAGEARAADDDVGTLVGSQVRFAEQIVADLRKRLPSGCWMGMACRCWRGRRLDRVRRGIFGLGWWWGGWN